MKHRFCFKCLCGNVFYERLSYDQRNDPVKCSCGKMATRQIGTNAAPLQVFDTVDGFTMIQQLRGQQEMLEKRSLDHYHEVDEKKIREEFPEDCIVEDNRGVKKEVYTKE